jgi:hypothetical protein
MNTQQPQYAFYIETIDGQEVRWSPLTKRQAVSMYNQTATQLPLNVKTYGWEELK